MKSKTSSICKVVAVASLVVTIILCINADEFVKQLQTAIFGLLVSLVFLSLAIIFFGKMKRKDKK